MNIIHVARIYPKGRPKYLFLKKEDSKYCWEKTDCEGTTSVQAIRNAEKRWKDEFFQLVHCGFRYSLPTRDEVGVNANFMQMAQSYSASNGRYFDQDAGHLCFVDLASKEALEIWKKIR